MVVERSINKLRRLANVPNETRELLRAIEALRQDLGALETKTAAREARVLLEMRRETLTTRALVYRRRYEDVAAVPPPFRAGSLDYAETLAALREAAPTAYEVWAPLLDVNATAYAEHPGLNCSVDGHELAELFGVFVKAHLRGAVLDVGCGPQAVPVYLRDYPVERIAGLDPIAPPSPHPFQYWHGFAEHMPWPDRSFKCAIAATSLDHVLILTKALKEIGRVLDDDGYFVLWVGFVPGAPKYNPWASVVPKIDAFHLFHFDRPWLEEVLAEEFIIEDSFGFHPPVNSHFYALRPRPRA